jgi:hypothetical protein
MKVFGTLLIATIIFAYFNAGNTTAQRADRESDLHKAPAD